MVKHIVLFKLRDDVDSLLRLNAMVAFKKSIELLPLEIKFIRKIEVGLNINSKEQWSIALYSEFDNLDDVIAYSNHPLHLAAAGLLSGVKESRACVDYEV